MLFARQITAAARLCAEAMYFFCICTAVLGVTLWFAVTVATYECSPRAKLLLEKACVLLQSFISKSTNPLTALCALVFAWRYGLAGFRELGERGNSERSSPKVQTVLPFGFNPDGTQKFFDVIRIGELNTFSSKERATLVRINGITQALPGGGTVSWGAGCYAQLGLPTKMGKRANCATTLDPGKSLESYVPGSLFDRNGILPADRGTVVIMDDYGDKNIVECTICFQKCSLDGPDDDPWTLILRHSLRTLRQRLEDGHTLTVHRPDVMCTPIGMLVLEQPPGKHKQKTWRDCYFVLPKEEDFTCLVNLDADEQKDFDRSLGQNLAPSLELILHDALCGKFGWDLSRLGVKTLKSTFGKTLGRRHSMRAVDNDDSTRCGVTSGMVPETDDNVAMVKRYGICHHDISNAPGGSSSLAWTGGGEIAFMHCGNIDGKNYCVPASVLYQLVQKHNNVNYEGPVDEGLTAFSEGVAAMIAAAGEKMDAAIELGLTTISPELLDNMRHHVYGKLESMGLPVRTAPEFTLGKPPGLEAAGSKASNKRLYAASKAGYVAGKFFKVMNNKELKLARDSVKKYKLSSKDHSSLMEMLYYYLGAKDEPTWSDRDRKARQRLYDGNGYHGDDDNMYAGVRDDLMHEWEQMLMHGSDNFDDKKALADLDKRIERALDHKHHMQEAHDAIAAHRVNMRVTRREEDEPTPAPKVRRGWNPHSNRKKIKLPGGEPGELESNVTTTVHTVGNDQFLDADALQYAKHIDECETIPPATADEVRAFDALVTEVLDKINTMTMDEFYQKTSDLQISGHVRDSHYFKVALDTHIVPADKITRDSPLKFARAMAHARSKGSNGAPMKEPLKEGLMATHADICWDSVNDEAHAVMPPTTAKAVIDSLNVQFKDRSRCKPLHPATMHILASGYPAVEWTGDITVQDAISDVFRSLILCKGVGWHLRPGITSKAQYVADAMSRVETVTRLAMLMVTPYDILSHASPWELYQCGFVLPEVLKVKKEAHKRSKVREGRWRVIWQTCISAEILCRFVHGKQNSAEVCAYQNGLTHSAEFPTFGNATGMGHDDIGLARTAAAIRRLIELLTAAGFAADRKGWDLSITRALWVADGLLRAYLAEAGGCPPSLIEAQLKIALILSAHVVHIGSMLYAVDILGIMGSGTLSTAASNGHMNMGASIDCAVNKLLHDLKFQALLADQKWEEMVVYVRDYLSLVMGDDSVNAGNIDAGQFVEHHAKLGIEVTGAEKGTLPSLGKERGAVPFTSHLYDLDHAADKPAGVFDNHLKLAWRLALLDSEKVSRDQAMGILFACRHSPFLPRIKTMLGEINPEYGDLDYLEGSNLDLSGFL